MSFPTGWNRRQPITIDNTKVGGTGTLSNYPVLITRANLDNEVCDPSGGNRAQADGGDIRFSSDLAGTIQLALEVVSFSHDTTTGSGDANVQMWVKVPSLSGSVDTTIYVWYNTAGTDTQPAVTDTYGRNSVWSSNYDLVSHYEQDPSGTPPQMVDSSGNGSNGTSIGSMTTGDLVTGKVGKGLDLDGVNDCINHGIVAAGSASGGISIACWVYTQSSDFAGKFNALVADNLGNPNVENGFFLILDSRGMSSAVRLAADTVSGGLRDVYANNAISTLGWYRIVGEYNPATSSSSIFVNGASLSVTVLTAGTGNYIPDTNQNLYVGALNDGSGPALGRFDEIHIGIPRGADWWATDYNNQNSPGTFATAGAPLAYVPPSGFKPHWAMKRTRIIGAGIR